MIEEARRCIPGMSCLPGCTACCAHIPWSKDEWDELPQSDKDRHTIHDLKCPFVSSEGCTVYEHRPLTCRFFGVTEGLECPRGAMPAVKLTELQASTIYNKYQKLFAEDK